MNRKVIICCVVVPQKRYSMEKWFDAITELEGFDGESCIIFNQYASIFTHGNDWQMIKDYNKAIEWYTKAAEQGHFESQETLAYAYYLGEDVPQDYEKAFKWTKIIVEKGGGSLQLRNLYARMYFYGMGVTKDYGKANELYTELVEHGDSNAQYQLGRIYYEGLGVEKNLKRSVFWYTKAAESGEEFSQFYLARMYYQGDGVIQDYVEAYKWANLAAMKNERNRGLRDNIKKEMTPEQIAEGQKKTREFHEKRQRRTR